MEQEYVEFSDMSKLVVFPREFENTYRLFFGTRPSLKIVPIVGMAGIGKTTLVNELYHHPNITSFYECRMWVKMGRNCRPEEIRRTILRQIKDPKTDEFMPDEGVEGTVRELLKARRYLIVLEDVWDLEVWRKLRNLFDYTRNHSAVLLTTRHQHVALGASDKVIQMPFLNSEESWDLLRTKVFGKESCPAELEKAGKKIAEKCDGLPLTIVTVADIMSKDDQMKTPEYWTQIAENKSSVFVNAYEKMYEVLYPSYEDLQLPHLKECFLYLGVFPQKYEIPTSKLIKLWSVENFLDPDPSKSSAELTVEYLEMFHSRNLVLTTQESSNGGTKTSRLHSVFLYLCSTEASKNKFFVVLNSYRDFLREGIESQSRFSINNNVLFAIKDVHDKIKSIPIFSLLCFGPYHQYHVPICLHSLSLAVVDALSIRFYVFPKEVEKLGKLKYLGITFNGQLPSPISKLKLLEFLIIRPHMRIKSMRVSRYLPMEIWKMKSLKHLQVTGSNLPDPEDDDALLPNLLTLLDVGAQSCTKNVLQRIPNLEKLGIQIDLQPNRGQPPPPTCFDYHVSHLQKLKSLKCVIVNPVLKRKKIVAAPPRLPDLPSGLRKFSLSGFGYPWEDMSKIASLPNLEVLKLRCFAFRGPKWEAHDWEFFELKYLLIEDTDLVDWTAASLSFHHIQRIILRNCYRLLDIPLKFWNNVFADLVDCNPSAAEYKVKHYVPFPHRKVIATNSW